jgi:rfaE bifunctional protein nucleotidyltransferase chain/domain
VLIVGVNSDDSVRRLKGPDRPLVGQADRAEVLAALACIDAVVIFDESTPEAILAQVRPDIHCKGGDYAPPHGRPVPEAALVESYGRRVAYLSFSPGVSTTELARRAAQGPATLRGKAHERRANFLDRDGTLAEDVGYLGRQLRCVLGNPLGKAGSTPRASSPLFTIAAEALAELSNRGFALVLISNQSGVGRGLITREQADESTCA